MKCRVFLVVNRIFPAPAAWRVGDGDVLVLVRSGVVKPGTGPGVIVFLRISTLPPMTTHDLELCMT